MEKVSLNRDFYPMNNANLSSDRLFKNMFVSTDSKSQFPDVLYFEQKENRAYRQPLLTSEFPTSNDILCARGRQEYCHEGNTKFQKIVEKYKGVYQRKTTSNTEKSKICTSIIEELRKLDPPSRFLEMNQHNFLWEDIGNVRMARKVKTELRKRVTQVPTATMKRKLDTNINENHSKKVCKNNNKKSLEGVNFSATTKDLEVQAQGKREAEHTQHNSQAMLNRRSLGLQEKNDIITSSVIKSIYWTFRRSELQPWIETCV